MHPDSFTLALQDATDPYWILCSLCLPLDVLLPGWHSSQEVWILPGKCSCVKKAWQQTNWSVSSSAMYRSVVWRSQGATWACWGMLRGVGGQLGVVGNTRIAKARSGGGGGEDMGLLRGANVGFWKHGGNGLHGAWDGERHYCINPFVRSRVDTAQPKMEWCCRLVVTAQGFDGRLLYAAQQLVSMQQAQCASPQAHTPTAGSLAPPCLICREDPLGILVTNAGNNLAHGACIGLCQHCC